MSKSLNRRRFVIQSVAGSLALPSLTSLASESLGGNTAVMTTRGAGVGAPRFVAVGNLLGFQQSQFFPETVGREFEETTLLKAAREAGETVKSLKVRVSHPG